MDATTMTRYLLGQLSEAERDACEQEWFTDKAQYVQLCEVENALIDDYVRGDLSLLQRQLFEQQFLTLPARRERVLTAQSMLREIELQNAASAAPQPQRWFEAWRQFRWFPSLAWATVVLLLVLGGWYFVQQRQTPAPLQPESATASEEQRRAQELAQQSARTQHEPSPSSSMSSPPATLRPSSPASSGSTARTLLFTLGAGTLRSEGAAQLPTLRLNKAVQRVQFQILLPRTDYKQFVVMMQSASGAVVTQWKGLRATRPQLAVMLSAKRLQPGDYVMVIRGISKKGDAEEIRRVPFNVSP